MKLTDLNAVFLKVLNDHTDRQTKDIREADGVMFLCPKCYRELPVGPQGTHSVICWFANRDLPPEKQPGPGRWNFTGTSLEDITFVGPGASSVLLCGEGGCHWHGYIKDGEAIDV